MDKVILYDKYVGSTRDRDQVVAWAEGGWIYIANRWRSEEDGKGGPWQDSVKQVVFPASSLDKLLVLRG